MNARRFAARSVITVVLALGMSACTETTVVRVYNGVPVEGRFIEYEAYAAYGRGLEAERDAHYDVAARWFLKAAQYDPTSVEIWSRLGSAYCSAGTHAESRAAFAEAERIDPTYEPLFRLRARCELHNWHAKEALAYIKHAVELDPDQNDAVVLYAFLLNTSQKTDEAVHVLDGHLLRHPNSVEGWQLRLDLAQQQKDGATAKHAAEVLLRLAPRLSKELTASVPEVAPLARVDEAIRQGNIDEARKAARHAHLPPAELAVRAAAIGATKLAREQAELVLGADPSSGSARVALASSSDALADATSVGVALAIPTGQRITPLSPLARLVYAELLVRHAERDAARAFVGSLEPNGTTDPVYEALRVHLVGRLGGTNVAKRGGT